MTPKAQVGQKGWFTAPSEKGAHSPGWPNGLILLLVHNLDLAATHIARVANLAVEFEGAQR
jgi:hypothetical protein